MEFGKLIVSPKFLSYLTQKNHRRRLVDDDDKSAEWLEGYLDLESARLESVIRPLTVIVSQPVGESSETEVLFMGPTPADAEAMIELIQEHGG